jgi:hypothetical protein
VHEKIYDVVWGGDRKPGADGELPPVATRWTWRARHGLTLSARPN